MKLIKGGNPPKVWSTRLSCSKCGAIMEIEGQDLKVKKFQEKYNFGDAYSATVRCMECEAELWVPQAPDSVMEWAYALQEPHWKFEGAK